MSKEIMIAGAGWLGRPLAVALNHSHYDVTVLSRSDEQSAFFNAQDISLIKLDYLQIEHSNINYEPKKTLIICIPPVPDYSSIINGLISTLAPRHIIF